MTTRKLSPTKTVDVRRAVDPATAGGSGRSDQRHSDRSGEPRGATGTAPAERRSRRDVATAAEAGALTARTLLEMVAADVLKLRKKRSIAGWALALTAGVALVFYAYALIAHAAAPAQHGPSGGLRHFDNAFTTFGLDFGTVAAILIGVEAGAGEIADGTLRELVITGRARLALFAARIPAAVILTLAVAACAMAVAIVVTFAFADGTPTPGAWLVLRAVAWVALANSVVCIVAVGLGALTGSRPAVLIGLVAWQTIASRLLIDTTALGGARRAVLDAALAQLKPGPRAGRGVAMPAVTAALIAALWAAIAVTAGAWRSLTRDL